MVEGRLRSPVSAALAAVVVLSGCSLFGGDDAKAEADKAKGGGRQLFVLSADEGRLQTEKKNEYTLTLDRAHQAVAVFTDRPQRKAGTESLATFVATWGRRGFSRTPPNAAVVWGTESSTRIFELSKPTYSRDDTLSFKARELGDEPSTALSSFRGTPDTKLPESLGQVSVFIDDASGEPVQVPSLDQQQLLRDDPSSEFLIVHSLNGPQGLAAQTFTAGLTGVLDRVDLAILPPKHPQSNLTVQIRALTSSTPDRSYRGGREVLASANVPDASFPTVDTAPTKPDQFVPVTFATPAKVTAGSRYAIVVYVNGQDTYPWWAVEFPDDDNPDKYAGGHAVAGTLSPGAGYVNWELLEGVDLGFRTFVSPAGTN